MIGQILGVMGIFSLLVATLYWTLGQFPTQKKTFLPLFLSMALFSIGFSLRLTAKETYVNFGYYLTDISFMFVYILFVVAMLLAEKKYWKIK